jgi:hypothetical protein
MGKVRVDLLLNDGSAFPGYANFGGFGGLDPSPFVQQARPILLLGEGIDFYSAYNPPPRETIDGFYRALGKQPSQVFPIRVRSAVALKGQPGEGILEGFAWWDCGEGGSREVFFLR